MTDDPTVLALLNDKIDQLGEHLNQRLDQQDKALADIRRQTRETNGRVTALERARERAQGAVAAYRWIGVMFGGLVSAGATILVLAASGGLH